MTQTARLAKGPVVLGVDTIRQAVERIQPDLSAGQLQYMLDDMEFNIMQALWNAREYVFAGASNTTTPSYFCMRIGYQL